MQILFFIIQNEFRERCEVWEVEPIFKMEALGVSKTRSISCACGLCLVSAVSSLVPSDPAMSSVFGVQCHISGNKTTVTLSIHETGLFYTRLKIII